MRVLVLGGTGRVGRLVVAGALARGHLVTVLARDAAKAPSGAQVVQGNALDAAAVERAVSGQDAVVYALGSDGPGATTMFSDSTRVLLPAMARHGVRRLVTVTGIGAGETKGHGGFVYDWFIYPLFTRKIYADKDRQEAMIRASALDWIIVRPAPFRGSPAGPLTVATDVTGVTLSQITPAEVAAFVVDQLESDTYLRQTPFIGHP